MAIQTFSARVARISLATPSVRRLSFERLDGQPHDFVAGQFIMVHFDSEGEALQRSYSIGCQPQSATSFEILVSYVDEGRGTRFLFGLQEGDTLELSGPYGRFCLRPESPRALWMVATGTGVVPYHAMLPELEARAAAGTSVHILQGVRRQEDILYRDAFEQAAARSAGLHFTACLSREPDAAAEGLRGGYVQDALLAAAPDPEHDLVYLCGNPAMIDDAVARLQALGFSPRALRREKYQSPKTPGAQ